MTIGELKKMAWVCFLPATQGAAYFPPFDLSRVLRTSLEGGGEARSKRGKPV